MKANIEINIPDGYEFDRVEDGKIVCKPIEVELPKTWKECLKKVGTTERIGGDRLRVELIGGMEVDYIQNKNHLPIGLGKPMLALCQLLICRNAWWGDWKPDWTNESPKYVIDSVNNKLATFANINTSRVLAFPTSEMCDEFYNTFKDLIEEAKELL